MAVALLTPNAVELTVNAAKKAITPTKVTLRNKFRNITLEKPCPFDGRGFFVDLFLGETSVG